MPARTRSFTWLTPGLICLLGALACDEGASAADPMDDAAVTDGAASDARSDAAPGDVEVPASDADPEDRPDRAPEADRGAGDAAADPPDADLSPDAAPFEPPARILFIGNSFTFGGPVPTIVDALANDAGWPDARVQYSAFGGESLQGHRNNRPQTLAYVDEGGWDVVVLQELSTRPTDNIGNPERFKEDATWFHDRVKASSPAARVFLYETWARHPDHAVYPNSYANPAEMQAQLRFHYNDAADRYIPMHAEAPVEPRVIVAPAGDAWEAHLAEPDPLRLHGDDDYHADLTGQYLNGLVIYSTIYGQPVNGLAPWRLDGDDAARLQRTADRLTRRAVDPLGLRPGQVVHVDLGDDDVGADWPERWNGFDGPVGGMRGLRAADGAQTSLSLRVTRAFGGVNGEGIAGNTLGLPGGASGDSFFCGSFDDHADGLTRPGRLRIEGLDPAGRYRAALFAARSGTDGDRGRLTRYTIGEAWVDLEVGDNRDRVATLDFAADEAGGADLEVAVSPDGAGRFCYLGALSLERLE